MKYRKYTLYNFDRLLVGASVYYTLNAVRNTRHFWSYLRTNDSTSSPNPWRSYSFSNIRLKFLLKQPIELYFLLTFKNESSSFRFCLSIQLEDSYSSFKLVSKLQIQAHRIETSVAQNWRGDVGSTYMSAKYADYLERTNSDYSAQWSELVC